MPMQLIDSIGDMIVQHYGPQTWVIPSAMQIWTWIFSYATTWLYAMVHPKYFDNQPNDSTYVPKSKRWTTLRTMTRKIRDIATNVAARVGETITQWTKYDPKLAKLCRMCKVLKKTGQQPKWSVAKTAMLAMAVIAMGSMAKGNGKHRQHKLMFDKNV